MKQKNRSGKQSNGTHPERVARRKKNFKKMKITYCGTMGQHQAE